MNIKLTPKQSGQLIGYVKDCVNRGTAAIAARTPSWKLMDESLNCYIHLSDAEQVAKNENKKAPVSIIFPFSLTALEILLAQCTMSFDAMPLYPCAPQTSGDKETAALLTHVLQYQARKFRHYLSHNIVFRNAWAYGLGVGVPSWEVCTSAQTYYDEEENAIKQVDGVHCEGNKITAVDPYQMIIDPSTPAQDLSKAAFFGWIEKVPKNALLRLADANGYLNVSEISKCDSTNVLHTATHRRHYGIRYRSTGNYRASTSLNPTLEVVRLMVDIVPESIGLSGNIPKRYLISCLGTEHILEMRELNVFYDEFPATPCCPTYDGYAALPMGKIESIQGMQDLLDFLFNSHIGNVRKTINDVLLVDPGLVNINDLMNRSENGGIVRMRKKYWGSGANVSAIQQLQIHDVTKNHINDAMFILHWMSQITGTDESSMGGVRKGGPERLTQTEYLGTMQQGAARMDHLLSLMALQYWNPIAMKMGIHTQQLMSESISMKLLSGFDDVNGLEDIQINNSDIHLPFDVSFVPKSTRVFSQQMQQVFQTIAQSETLQQSFDVPAIFEDVLRSQGIKDISQYRIKQMPDEQMRSELNAGNIIPIEGAPPTTAPGSYA